MTKPLTLPLTLPCGVTLPNRVAKAAMTEGLADARQRPTDRLNTLYRRWAMGGSGLLITGNVQIDREVLERPGNVVIAPDAERDSELLFRLRAWAVAGTSAGNALWMQINHAGRQSPRYVTRQPVGPSAVKLDLMGNYAIPRALTDAEIRDLIGRYARVAAIAKLTGFTGVQIHAAHGYLLSSFLSPVTNRRSDSWGGSLANRARMLLETVRATRAAVGPDFPVSVKLNSDDFRQGGFSHEECLQVVAWLNDEGIDLLEISGGTYEQPRLLGHTGREDTVRAEAPAVRESTRRREAYFLEYAAAIRQVARMPLMVTGGFRSKAAMEQALNDGDCDLIGLGRPLCTDPDTVDDLLAGRIDRVPAHEDRLRLAERGLFSPASPLLPLKLINVLGGQAWYYQQIFRLADGLPGDPDMGLLRALAAYYHDELRQAWRIRRPS